MVLSYLYSFGLDMSISDLVIDLDKLNVTLLMIVVMFVDLLCNMDDLNVFDLDEVDVIVAVDDIHDSYFGLY